MCVTENFKIFTGRPSKPQLHLLLNADTILMISEASVGDKKKELE
jgi:hypothetical protein